MKSRTPLLHACCFLVLALFIWAFEGITYSAHAERLEAQARMLSEHVWDLNEEETRRALRRIMVVEGTSRASITHTDGREFVRERRSDSKDRGLDALALKIGLVRHTPLVAPIRHDSELVGHLHSHWHNRNGYVYLVFALLVFMSAHLYYFYQRARTAQQGLRKQVAETAAAETQLRESQHFLNSVFETIGDGIMVVDRNLNVLRTNQAMVRTYPWAEPLVGRSCREAFRPPSQGCEDCPARTALETGRPASGLMPLRNAEGKTVGMLETRSYPVQNSAGQTVMAVLCSRDVTRQREMQTHLNQAEKMAAVGQLAGGIAHDFNNRLVPIVGFGEWLLESLDDPALRDNVQRIVDCARRAAELTDQLVAFARKGEYRMANVDVHHLVREVVAILSHSIDRRISIREHLDPSLRLARGDETQLQSALLNLALNARDAMPDGGTLTFEARNVELSEQECRQLPFDTVPGPYVRLAVTDTGSGMDRTTRKRVFEPFFTTKPPGKGTGMGLAVVYGTLEQHGGSIELITEPGKGSTFAMYLPVSEGVVETGGPSRAEAAAATATAPCPRRGARILVVDDDADVRSLLEKILSVSGHEVVCKRDGREALDYYRENWQQVDLVILDIVMPRMDGLQAFTLMREINPHAKVLISSGYSFDSKATRMLEDGAKALLQKPFRVSELREKVAEVLGD